MSRAREPGSDREIIFEFQSIGEAVRVAAVDVATGEEVVIQGPAGTPQRDLERLAARKLMRRLVSIGEALPDTQTPRRGGRGVIV